MRKKTPKKKEQEPKQRLNAIVKKATEGIKQRDGIKPETPNNAHHPVAIS